MGLELWDAQNMLVAMVIFIFTRSHLADVKISIPDAVSIVNHRYEMPAGRQKSHDLSSVAQMTSNNVNL